MPACVVRVNNLPILSPGLTSIISKNIPKFQPADGHVSKIIAISLLSYNNILVKEVINSAILNVKVNFRTRRVLVKHSA